MLMTMAQGSALVPLALGREGAAGMWFVLFKHVPLGTLGLSWGRAGCLVDTPTAALG